MSSAVNQWFETKGIDPFGDMTFLAVFLGELHLDRAGILLAYMLCPWPMTNLAACVFEMWRFFEANESTGFAVSCGMTTVTLLNLAGS